MMMHHLVGIALCAMLVALTVLAWRRSIPARARETCQLWKVRGTTLAFDEARVDRAWSTIGIRYTVGAAVASVLLAVADLAISLNLDLPRILLLNCLIAVVEAAYFPRSVLKSYWIAQADHDGVDLLQPRH